MCVCGVRVCISVPPTRGSCTRELSLAVEKEVGGRERKSSGQVDARVQDTNSCVRRAARVVHAGIHSAGIRGVYTEESVSYGQQ